MSDLKINTLLAMALDATTIIMHNRGVSGGPSLVLSLSVGSPYEELVVSAGAHMQNPPSQRGPICRTHRISGEPSLASPPPHKRRPVCLQKTLFELERCSNVMIISARCLQSSGRCLLLIMILIGPLKFMGSGVIVPPCPLLLEAMHRDITSYKL